MDEIWINAVYRPFFGERSPLGGDLRANIMDRALQFSLDRETRIDRELMAHVARGSRPLRSRRWRSSFIDRDTLGRWRELITGRGEPAAGLGAVPLRAGRHLREAGDRRRPSSSTSSCESLPDLVDETLRYLTSERIEDVPGRASVQGGRDGREGVPGVRIVRGAEEARRTAAPRDAVRGGRSCPRPSARRSGASSALSWTRRRWSTRILRDVRSEGDAAVRRYNEEIDGVPHVARSLEVSARRDRGRLRRSGRSRW